MTKDRPVASLTVGKIDSEGIPLLTIQPDEIRDFFSQDFDVKSIDHSQIYYNSEDILIFEAGGLMDNGMYIIMGSILSVGKDGLVMLTGTCTQSCTSVAPCQGCSLTIQSDCSGYCDCSPGFGGSCTHTVKTKDAKVN